MNKLRAFLIHFVISATVVATVFAIIFFVWYPAPYFKIIGAWAVLKVLIGVDLVLGPLLTLIVYKPNKPSLKFDLSVIALIQISALVYGTSVIYQERPYFTVFTIDRFTVLAKKDVDLSLATDPTLLDKPLIGPIQVVARMPGDPEEQQQLLNEVLFENKPDLDRRPNYWVSLDQGKNDIVAAARPLSDLKATNPDLSGQIDAALERYADRYPDLAFLPIIGRKTAFTLLIDPKSGVFIAVLAIDPWPIVEPET